MIKQREGFFISGTDTGIGKTIVSATLAYKLKGHYWKPIQCGFNKQGETDSDVVKRVTKGNVEIINERYLLNHAISPNLAAKKKGVSVELKKLNLPKKIKNPLIIEGAGGLLVPLNEKKLVIDLVKKFSLPLILVSSTKLGTINHTLLSVESILNRKINLRGIVFVGDVKTEVTNTIKVFAKRLHNIKNKKIILGCLPKVKKVNFETIKKFEKIINI